MEMQICEFLHDICLYVIDGFVFPFLTVFSQCTREGFVGKVVPDGILSHVSDFVVSLFSACVCVALDVSDFSIESLIIELTTFSFDVCVLSHA
jgi:hypothetical protein